MFGTGLVRSQETDNSEWTWSDGWPPVYANWDPQNGPDPADSSCGSLNSGDGRWKNDDCSRMLHAFCKKTIGQKTIYA